MQQELKFEAFRMEAIRKSCEATCFAKCVAEPDGAIAVLAKALPDRIPGVQPEMTEVERKLKNDLTSEEAICVDRCAWKYMLTAKICLQTLNKSKNLKDPQLPGGKM